MVVRSKKERTRQLEDWVRGFSLVVRSNEERTTTT